MEKYCPRCETTRLLINYNKNKTRKDGLSGWCKKCINENNKVYRSQIQSIKIRAVWLKSYRQADPGRTLAWTRQRQLSKLKRTPLWLTKEQIAEIKSYYVLAKELQWLSTPTDPLTVDHIVPLNGKNVSGLHVPWNLQILPMSLNSAKGNCHESRT